MNAVSVSSLNLPDDWKTRNKNEATIGMPNSAGTFDFRRRILFFR